MKIRTAAIVVAIAAAALSLFAAESPAPPKAGPVEIMPLSQIKPGMQATAWTVFQGTQPEPVPIEIIGRYRNAWGPKQDIIIAKMGGKAARTNVAGGMSGSPVYIDGKLIGAVALRLSVFSPDAICGITPIELMLEINEFDSARPEDAKTPDKAAIRKAEVSVPSEMLQHTVSAGASSNLPKQFASMVPIEAPLAFSGFHENTLREFAPLFQQIGVTPVQGGASAGDQRGSKPVAGWEQALNPGDAIAGVLVNGDFNVQGMGTVTYNDGKA